MCLCLLVCILLLGQSFVFGAALIAQNFHLILQNANFFAHLRQRLRGSLNQVHVLVALVLDDFVQSRKFFQTVAQLGAALGQISDHHPFHTHLLASLLLLRFYSSQLARFDVPLRRQHLNQLRLAFLFGKPVRHISLQSIHFGNKLLELHFLIRFEALLL